MIGELAALLKAAGIASPSPSEGAALDDAILDLFVSSIKEAPGAWSRLYRTGTSSPLGVSAVQKYWLRGHATVLICCFSVKL